MERSTIDELDAFVKANGDIGAVEAFITDPNGVARGKLLRASELAALYRAGRPLPGSILCMDTTGMEVDQLVWDAGDADKVAFPVAGSLRRASWRSVPTAQVLLSLWEPDGRPHGADPRHVLAGVVARLETAGFVPVVSAELEFYLVDPVRGPDGNLQPPRTPHTRRRLDQIDSFSVTELEELAPFLDELFAAARAMELPAETVISEYAPGQLEIVLRHRADAMRAADEAVQWKRLVRGVAAKHGLLATFMAKPFSGRAGSGLHVHASLDDESGHNLFASEDPQGTPLMRHAIGGLLSTLEESIGVFAPNANSYRRFQALSYAPVSRTWGVNNRSVAVRIPTGAPATRHLEHRVAGADANPYLAIAAVLAGIHKGVVERLEPGPATEGNGYAGTGARLPNDWQDALRRLRESKFLEAYFGARFLEIFHAIKTTECQRFSARVTELDLDWYLTRA
jgi:glutamine synthetase